MLDADLAEVGEETLDSGVVPPVDDDRFELREQSQMRHVLLDGTPVGRRLLDLGVERIDSRMPGVRLGKRCVKILMRQRVAQT